MRPTSTSTLDPSGHVLLLRRAERDRQAAAADWVRVGLTRHERVLLPADDLDDVLAASLQRDDVDLDAALVAGDVVAVPRQDLLAHDRLPGLVTKALDAGHAGLRLCFPDRDAAPAGERQAVERSLDDLCRTGPVSAMCASGDLDEDALVEATGVHAAGVDAERLRARSSPDGRLYVAGDVDAGNGPDLRAVVRASAWRAERVLEVDVSEVGFLAAAGVQALVAGTREYRRGGGSVRVGGAAPQVEAVLRASGGFDALSVTGRRLR